MNEQEEVSNLLIRKSNAKLVIAFFVLTSIWFLVGIMDYLRFHEGSFGVFKFNLAAFVISFIFMLLFVAVKCRIDVKIERINSVR